MASQSRLTGECPPRPACRLTPAAAVYPPNGGRSCSPSMRAIRGELGGLGCLAAPLMASRRQRSAAATLICSLARRR
jgi:hypothetical protein